MGRHLWTTFSPVCEDNLFCVYGDSSVGVNSHTKQTRVCLQKQQKIYNLSSLVFIDRGSHN